MTDENLEIILKTISLNGKYINNKTAMYIETNKYSIKNKYIDQFIVLLDCNIRVGGLYIMGDFDLHFIIFDNFRGKKYLSNFLRSGFINKIRPTLKKASICNKDDSKKIKHLLKLANLKIKKDYNDW